MKLQSNIWKFYILRIFLRSLVFPVLVVYFLRSGLSALQVGLVFSIGIYVAFLLELPSGYISDKIGHKYAITVCFVMKALSMLCYLGGTFWWFTLAEILFVGGGALWSGTGEAFFYETMNDLKRISDFEKLFGRSMAVGLATSSIFLIAMPFLYAYNVQLIFILNFGLLLIPLVISFTLTQPSYSKPVAKIEGWWGVVHEWKSIGRFIVQHKRFRSLIFFYSFWQAVQDAIDTFSQLFFTYLKIPVQFFGAIYATNRVLQAVGGQVAYRFTKTMSSLKILALFSVELVLFFFLGAYAKQSLSVLIFPARNFFEGVSSPISSSMINKEITEGYRVTLLSVEPTITRLIEGALVLALGVLFNIFSVPNVFLIMGITTTLFISILYFSVKREMPTVY